MDGSSESKAEWVNRGLISACECFSCVNKINHRLRGNRVRILCRRPCNFQPLKGEAGSTIDKITDIEQE